MAAPATALVGAKATADEAKGLIKTVMDALNHNIVSFRFERDPKNYRKMRLAAVEINITTGIVLGAAALALLWEIGNWFAKSGVGGGDGAAVPDILSLITANPVMFVVTDLLGNVITDPSTGAPKQVAVPSTFGAAYDAMLRDFIAGGPGTIAQMLRNVVAQFTTGGTGSGGASGSSSGAAPGTPANPLVRKPIQRPVETPHGQIPR